MHTTMNDKAPTAKMHLRAQGKITVEEAKKFTEATRGMLVGLRVCDAQNENCDFTRPLGLHFLGIGLRMLYTLDTLQI